MAPSFTFVIFQPFPCTVALLLQTCSFLRATDLYWWCFINFINHRLSITTGNRDQIISQSRNIFSQIFNFLYIVRFEILAKFFARSQFNFFRVIYQKEESCRNLFGLNYNLLALSSLVSVILFSSSLFLLFFSLFFLFCNVEKRGEFFIATG